MIRRVLTCLRGTAAPGPQPTTHEPAHRAFLVPLVLALLALAMTLPGQEMASAQTVTINTAADYVTAINAANASSGGTVTTVDATSGNVVSLGGVTLPALTGGMLQISDGNVDTPIADGAITNNTQLTFFPPASTNDVVTTNISGSGGVTVNLANMSSTGAQFAGFTLAGNNTYTGGTTISGEFSFAFPELLGAATLASTAALPGYGTPAANGSITLTNFGGLATGYALDQTTLNALNTGSVGFVALGANSANNLSFASLPQVSLGAVYDPTGVNPTWTYSGTLMPTSGSPNSQGAAFQYLVGGGNGVLTIASNLGDNGAATELDAINTGYTILSGTNTFTGGMNVMTGVVQLATPSAYCGGFNDGCGAIVVKTQGILATSYALDQTTVNAIDASSAGVVALGANSSNNLIFTGQPNLSLGAVGSYTYSGTITPGANGYLLGGGNDPRIGFSNLTVSSALTECECQSDGLTVNAQLTDAGEVTLTAANTYTGPTVIQAGTLSLGNGTTNGTISPLSAVTNNALLVFNEATAITFANAISGPGSLNYDGPGTVTFTAPAAMITYTGPTSIENGTLALGPGSSIASSSTTYILAQFDEPPGVLDISNAGNATVQNLQSSQQPNGGSVPQVVLGANTLTIDANGGGIFGATSTFGGVISGTGGLVKMGSNTEILSGPNTYSGGTTISQGTLQLGGTGFGAGVSTVGTLGSGPVVNNANLTFTEPSAVTFANAISGTGTVTQSGPGAITLNGASTYTGLTEVTTGTLVVGDSANDGASVGGSVLVDAGATLAGYGSLGVATSGTTLTNNGTVVPGAAAGNAVGTLSAAGNYVQGSGGNLLIAVTPTQASQLHVGGSATLAGTITFAYAPGTYSPITYTVLAAGGAISGTFGTVTEQGSVPTALTRTVEYETGVPDPVLLVLSGGPITPPPAPVAVAPPDGSIFSEQLASLTTLADSSVATLLDGGGGANDCFTGGVPPAQSEPGVPSQASSSVAAIGRMICNAGGWIHLDGTFFGVSSGGGYPSYHADTAGFLAGVDRPVGDSGLRLGIAAGYDHRWLNDGAGGSAMADVARFGVYAIQPVGPVVLNAAFLYGHDWDNTNRPTGVGTATAQYGGNEISGGVRASLPITLGGFAVIPMGGVRFASVGAASFAETGSGSLSGFGVSGAGTTQLSAIPYARVVVASDFVTASGLKISPYAAVGYQYQAGNTAQPVLLTAADGTTFNVGSTSLDRSAGTFGVGVAAGQGNWSVFASYGALVSGNWQQQEIDAGLRVNF